MKTKMFFGAVALSLISGCVATVPQSYYGQYPTAALPQQVVPPVQYVAPVGCIPPYYPVWNGCALPMVYAPMYPGYYGYGYGYGRPITEFGIRFGKNGRNFIHGLW